MISANLKSGATFTSDEKVTVQKLNALGVPTVTIEGTVETEQIASGSVTTAKMDASAVTDGVVADAAAIQLSKLESVSDGLFVAGNSAGVVASHELLGDVSFTRARKIGFDGDTGLQVGQTIRIQLVGGTIHTGEVVKIDSGAGELYYRPISSTDHNVDDNSDIHYQGSTLTYTKDSANPSFAVGSTVNGAGGGSGIITAKTDSTLSLRSISGFFFDGEELRVDSVLIGTVDTDGGITQIASVNGAGSELTDILVSAVEEASTTGTVVQVSEIKAEGTSGQVLTSNGTEVAPTFQNVNATIPAIIQKQTSTGTSGSYVQATPTGVTNNAIETDSSGDGFHNFVNGDKVILTDNGDPQGGALLYTVYYIHKVNNSDHEATLHTNTIDAATGDNEVSITSFSGSKPRVVKILFECGGTIGGDLFPDLAVKDKGCYVLVFNQQIDNYFFNATGFKYDAYWSDGSSLETQHGAVFIQFSNGSNYSRFRLMLPQSYQSDLNWKYVSLMLNSYD